MNKPRLLVVTTRFPFPLYGGDVLRIFRICEELSKLWSISLVSICQSREELVQELPQDSPFDKVHRIVLPKWRSYLQVLLALFTGKCLQVAYYNSVECERLVESLSFGHDAVLCHLARAMQYANKCTGFKFVEMTDYIPLTYDRSNALSGKMFSLRKMLYQVEKSRIEFVQRVESERFQLITVVSQLDRDLFIEATGVTPEKLRVFPNGVDLNDRHFRCQRSGRKLAFIGNLAAMPNVDAVRYFIDEIMPIVCKKYPDVTLKVIGRVDRGTVRRYADHDGVEFTGVVASLDSATEDCVIGLSPLRIGAGLQNKVLDYMSLGLPVVSTSVAIGGVECIPGTHVLVGDSPMEFAHAILQLLVDETKRELMALAGRKLVEESYSWLGRLQGFGEELLKSISKSKSERQSPPHKKIN